MVEGEGWTAGAALCISTELAAGAVPLNSAAGCARSIRQRLLALEDHAGGDTIFFEAVVGGHCGVVER
jgi:hypothetical protein